MSPATFLLLFGALAAAALAGLVLIEREAARSRARHRGELAFDRHQRREMDRRAEVSRRAILAMVGAAAEALSAAHPGAPAGEDPALEAAPCAPQPGRCVLPARLARRPDGHPDTVRRMVYRAVAEHPRAIGHLVFRTDPRAPWRPMFSALPGGEPRPAILVTVWGHG